MNCPSCKDVTLSMADRNGIEIDFCPKCRGVWLDRGELDKIIEKSAAQFQPVETQTPQPQPMAYSKGPEVIIKHDPYSKDYYKYKRKKSFLEEIFD